MVGGGLRPFGLRLDKVQCPGKEKASTKKQSPIGEARELSGRLGRLFCRVVLDCDSRFPSTATLYRDLPGRSSTRTTAMGTKADK